jgi:hypothetical protein
LAEFEASSLEDFLLEIASSKAGPPSKARIQAEAVLALLRASGEELRAGDLRQAGEKIWGTAALAVNVYAYHREGVRLSSHGGFWHYAKKIADELSDWVRDIWVQANTRHANFYEGGEQQQSRWPGRKNGLRSWLRE